MWDWIKKPFKIIELIYTILNMVALFGVIFLPFTIHVSNTLRGFIAGFAIFGGVFGYYFTVTAWADKDWGDRLRQRKKYLAAFWIPLTLFVLLLDILRPQMATHYPPIRPIRDFLLNAVLTANMLIGISAAMALYFLIGAITLSSRKLSQSDVNEARKSG